MPTTTQAAVLAFFLAVSAGLWAWVFVRVLRGDPVLPLARRRPAPWQGQDVLAIFFAYVLIPGVFAVAVHWQMPPNGEQPAADQKKELTHEAQQLLESNEPVGIAVAAIMAVIIAPLIEEFLFRVVMQGWLEAVWSRTRRKRPQLRTPPLSLIPIVLPAAIFALMHFRVERTPLSMHVLVVAFVAQIAADLMVVTLAIGLLRFAAGATAADLGWQPTKFLSDAKLALLGLLAVAPPILAMNAALKVLFSAASLSDVAPDPIPLFFLALVFGVLYQRTHRIAPSLVLHMAFNATSVALIFAG